MVHSVRGGNRRKCRPDAWRRIGANLSQQADRAGGTVLTRQHDRHPGPHPRRQARTTSASGSSSTIAAAPGQYRHRIRRRAAPYTIVLGTVSTHAINASVYSKLPYDPIKDFAPIIEFGAVPQVLVVVRSLPIKSVQDLIEYARAARQVTYGSAGNGTTNHLSGALLRPGKAAMVHVPYRGGAQAITDLLANEIVFMFYPYAALLPHIRTGALRALGTTARIAALPDVPTLAEAKLADFEINAWFGVFAPAERQPIVDRLNAEMARIITDPAVQERLIQQGHRTRYMDRPRTSQLCRRRISSVGGSRSRPRGRSWIDGTRPAPHRPGLIPLDLPHRLRMVAIRATGRRPSMAARWTSTEKCRAAVLDHRAFEFPHVGVARRRGDATIRNDPGEPQALDAAFAQCPFEARSGTPNRRPSPP